MLQTTLFTMKGHHINKGRCKLCYLSVYLTFYIIYLYSNTTTQEVIKALLSKFKITDNPRKFALYEKVIEGEKGILYHNFC